MTMRRYMLLIETMQQEIVLLEGRIDFLRTKFVPVLAAALEQGMTVPVNIANKLRFHDTTVVPNAPQRDKTKVKEADLLFNYVVEQDPDPVKKSSQWLLTLITRKQMPMPLEDLEYATEALVKFSEMKKARLIPVDKSDINKFRSLSDLNATIRGEVEQQQDVVASIYNEMLSQSNVLYNGSDYSVISPLTKEAAGYFGRNTEWCTAWGYKDGRHPTRGGGYFDQYTKEGPLYIITDKNTDNLWQFSFASNQFMDVNDRSINLQQFLKSHPAINKVFEALDGEPIAKIGSDDFAYAHGRGFIIKKGRGPQYNPVLTVRVRENGVVDNFYGINQFISIVAIQKILTSLDITGEENHGEYYNGLFYRHNRWGTIQQLGTNITGSEGYIWKMIDSDNFKNMVLVSSQGSLLNDEVVFMEAIVSKNEEGTISINRSAKLSPTIPAISHAIVHMLLHDDTIQRWSATSEVRPFHLDAHDAENLINYKPQLGDLPTVYQVHGVTDMLKKLIMEWCDHNYINKPHGFGGDDIIIEVYPDVADLIENIGTPETKYLSQRIENDGSDNYDSYGAEDNLKDLIRKLGSDNLAKLGSYLQDKHADYIEENLDGEFNSIDFNDIIDLIKETDDDDVMSAVKNAVASGNQYGAENEMYNTLYSAVIENYNVVCETTTDGKSIIHDTVCQSVLPIKDLMEKLKTDQYITDELSNEGWIKAFEIEIKIDEPYYGYQGYDEEAAQETFSDLLEEFID